MRVKELRKFAKDNPFLSLLTLLLAWQIIIPVVLFVWATDDEV